MLISWVICKDGKEELPIDDTCPEWCQMDFSLVSLFRQERHTHTV